jgi:peptidoglycan LD-endopeptidase LytH
MISPQLKPDNLQAFMDANHVKGELLELETLTPTVESAARAVNAFPEQIVKSILFLVGETPILAVGCGTTSIDKRAIAVHYSVGRKRVKLASPEQVLKLSGYGVGAMPPFGHFNPIPTLIDPSVLTQSIVYTGGGAENTLIRISPNDILRITRADVVTLQKAEIDERGAAGHRFIVASSLLLALIVGLGLLLMQNFRSELSRSRNVIAWIRDPGSRQDWAITAGDQCGEAPFVYPTSGFIGFLWDDSFRPGHRHQGIDIFGGEDVNQTPVIAAYSGYLTRLPEWRSSVIVRIPVDPLNSGRQIWVYYTHMADKDGNAFIMDDFPPGTYEKYVEAGELLGYQGNYSGDPLKPTGVHLHFSIVKDDGQGRYQNELEIENTLDPSPYLGLQLNAKHSTDQIPLCSSK